MENSVAKYRNKIVYMSFILSLMVVMIHSYNIDTFCVESPVLIFAEDFVTSLSRIAVPTFFTLSGFLFFQNYEPSMYISKIKKRFFSVFVPFIIWNLVAYLMFVGLSAIPFVSSRMNTEVAPLTVKNLFLNLFSTDYNTTWFLKNLMVYIVAVPFLYPLLKNKYVGVFLVAFVPIVGCYISNNYLIQSLFYLFGAYAALHFKNIVQSQYKEEYQVVSCIVLIALTLVRQEIYAGGMVSTSILCNLILLIQIVLTWISADVFSIEVKPKWWMSISFFIYITHDLILEPIEKVFLIVLGEGTAGAIIDYLLAPTITLLLIVLSAGLLRKYCNSIWNVLTGNRG